MLSDVNIIPTHDISSTLEQNNSKGSHHTMDSCETHATSVQNQDDTPIETNEGTCRSSPALVEKEVARVESSVAGEPPFTSQATLMHVGNDDVQTEQGSSSVTPSSSTTSSPLASYFPDIKKRGKPDAPKFLLLLYEILHSESDQVICWSEDGLALQILDQNAVTETILPKYFNHTNFHSFQRQLNYFGFRKWTKSKTDICTFSHMYFRRHQPELLSLIKRKKAPRRNLTTETNTGPIIPVTLPHQRTLLPSRKKRTLSTHPGYDNDDDHQLQSPYGPSLINSIGEDGHISPVAASGGKKKAKKGRSVQDVPSSSPSSPHEGTKVFTEGIPKISTSLTVETNGEVYLPTLDQHAQSQAFSNVILPNLDIIRNRLMVRQATTNSSCSTSSTTTPTSLSFNSMMNSHYKHLTSSYTHGSPLHHKLGSVGALELERRPPPIAPSTTTSTISVSVPKISTNAIESTTTPMSGDESSPRFSNSFSDPVDILLRIKKSRALSSDTTSSAGNTNNNTTTNLLSPQAQQDQADNLASLQNFLLSQSLYTNQLEAQLKLSSDENEALRQLLEAKTREIDALQNERKILQNENSVLMEGKNKLFEINRDLLNKLL